MSPMPKGLLASAQGAAKMAGFPGFVPSVCTIGYEPGARFALQVVAERRSLQGQTLPGVYLELLRGTLGQ